MIKILFSLFFIFLSTQAQAYTSSAGAYTIDAPASWQIGDPQKGCNPHSFCFVMNPDQSEVVFMEPFDAKKVKDSNQTLIQNLLNIIVLKESSSEEQLQKYIQNTVEGLSKLLEGGLLKQFEVLKQDKFQSKKLKGFLLYWMGQWGNFPVNVMQLYISGPQSTLLLSCSYDPAETKRFENICMNTFKSLRFQ